MGVKIVGWPLIISAAIALIGIDETRKANEEAAQKQEQAARNNVQFLSEAGEQGQEIIAEEAKRALEAASGAPGAAIDPLRPFADVGLDAFLAAQDRIVSGASAGGINESIVAASKGFQDGLEVSSAVNRELNKQAGFTGERITPQVNEALLALGGRGLAAAGDISGIETRAGQREADILTRGAAGEASALIGQTPQISSEVRTAETARLLSDVAPRQQRVQSLEQLAALAGRMS
jgi:hypothetical protein